MAHELDDITALTWTPLTAAELPELSGLIAAIEYIDDPLETTSLSDLEQYFHAIGSEPEHLTLVGRERGGSLVAWGWNQQKLFDRRPARMWLRGGVHPAWRNQHIGRHLIGWQMDAARAWFHRHHPVSDGPLRMIAHAEQRASGRCALYEEAGLTARRYFVDMMRPDLAQLPTVEVVDGLVMVPVSEDLSDAVREAHNEVFGRGFGSSQVSPDAWAESMARPSIRRDLSLVALSGEGEVVGYAICGTFETEPGRHCGWVERLGVLPQHRRRGAATALLSQLLHVFADAGLSSAGIGIDAEGAVPSLGVYERLGFTAAETMIMYARDES